MVELPVTIDWGPGRSYDLGQDADRRVVYERVLREAASTSEVCPYVNGQALLDVWGRLWLPRRVRSSWEECFPELVRAAWGVEELQDRLARIGLGRLSDYGFVLAGGYALQAHGLVQRMSEDVDLSIDRWDVQDFAQAVSICSRRVRAGGKR